MIYHQSVFETWPFEDKSIQAIITSPPFYSLRKYSIPDVIIGGDENCQHEWQLENIERETGQQGAYGRGNPKTTIFKEKYQQGFCLHCSAWRGQYGLEPDYKLYVEHSRLWAKEAWRVLRDDGVMFLNLADSYCSSGGASRHRGYNDPKYPNGRDGEFDEPTSFPQGNMKPKCQLLIPHRVAMALVDDGWILRNTICWYKPNAMPESCKDRFSKKYEYVFMFSKSNDTHCWRHNKIKQWTWEKPEPDYYFVDGKRRNHWEGYDYYFDLDEVREEHIWKALEINRLDQIGKSTKTEQYAINNMGRPRADRYHDLGKNPGNLWTINTSPSSEKHYAMWPQKLVERMILCSTKPGDAVLDPFCGSGTTLRVAEELNRVGYGIDLGYEDIQERKMSLIQKSLL